MIPSRGKSKHCKEIEILYFEILNLESGGHKFCRDFKVMSWIIFNLEKGVGGVGVGPPQGEGGGMAGVGPHWERGRTGEWGEGGSGLGVRSEGAPLSTVSSLGKGTVSGIRNIDCLVPQTHRRHDKKISSSR